MMPPESVVVYGDADTIGTRAELVQELADKLELRIAAWHGDPQGARGVTALDQADGLILALADCARLGASLMVPFPIDLPGERSWRLVAHWLHRRGLRLQLGPVTYCWEHARDEIDFALRRQLEAASDLEVAVIAAGAMPDLDGLLTEIVGRPEGGEPSVKRSLVDTDPRFQWIRECRDYDVAAGLETPAEPDATANWFERSAQVKNFAEWLQAYASQSVIADVLNALGVRPRRGERWTQPMISRLLRAARTSAPNSGAA